MRVEDWFRGWALRHIDRTPRADWPEPSSEFWTTHRAAFVKHGVAEAVAEDASRLMAESPPAFLDRHLETLLGLVRQVWKSAEVASPVGSREEAERLSKSCPDCSGMGLATRYRHTSIGPGKPEAVVFYCLCPMGRWIERNHREGTEEARRVRSRMHDLLDFPEFHLRPVSWSAHPDNKHCHRLAEWQAMGEPAAAHDVPPRPMALGRMLKRAGEVPAF